MDSAAVSSPGRVGTFVRLSNWFAREQHLLGAAFLRIALATIVLYQLVGHWSERHLLWGPHGLYPLWLFERDLASTGAPSFFALESTAAFDAVYGLSICVAALYLIGCETRWTGAWLFVMVWSLIKRNPLLTSGGDTLMLVMLPFVLLMNTSAYYSVDATWRTHRTYAGSRPWSIAALVHNGALCGLWAQLAIFYGFAGAYKLLGDTWRDGTAVYYALRLQDFTLSSVNQLIYTHATVVMVLTYATVAFELSVPLLIWSRRTRWLIPLAALPFHAAIALVLGLVVFSAQASVFHLTLLDDRVYRLALSCARTVMLRASEVVRRT